MSERIVRPQEFQSMARRLGAKVSMGDRGEYFMLVREGAVAVRIVAGRS